MCQAAVWTILVRIDRRRSSWTLTVIRYCNIFIIGVIYSVLVLLVNHSARARSYPMPSSSERCTFEVDRDDDLE